LPKPLQVVSSSVTPSDLRGIMGKLSGGRELEAVTLEVPKEQGILTRIANAVVAVLTIIFSPIFGRDKDQQKTGVVEKENPMMQYEVELAKELAPELDGDARSEVTSPDSVLEDDIDVALETEVEKAAAIINHVGRGHIARQQVRDMKEQEEKEQEEELGPDASAVRSERVVAARDEIEAAGVNVGDMVRDIEALRDVSVQQVGSGASVRSSTTRSEEHIEAAKEDELRK